MRFGKSLKRFVKKSVITATALSTSISSLIIMSVTANTAANGISFVSATSGQNNIATTLTLTVPNTTSVGDVLFASVDVEHNPAITAPAGWTLIRSDTNPNALNLEQADFYHVVTGSEPTSYTWTFSAAHGASGGIIDYSGVNTSQPVDVSSGQSTSANTTQIVSPSLTTSFNNEVVIDITGDGVNRTLTPPSNLTTRYTASTTTSGEKTQVLAADETMASAGATGNQTVVASGSSVGIGQLIALLPASSSSVPDTQPPTAPSNLQETYSDTANVSLSWKPSLDNVGVAGYTVYVNGAAITTTTNTSYTVGSLTCGTSYNLAVDAFDAAGNHSSQTSITASTSACPDTTPPSAPGNFAQTGSTNNSIDVSWSASLDNVGVAGYNLYMNGTLVATTTGTSYTYAGLSCSNSYNLSVDAFDAAGNTSSQDSISGSTSTCVVPTNTPPTATVSLSSNTPDTDAMLTASATTQDPNGLPVTLTYVWQVNGQTTQTDTTTSLTDNYDLSLAGNGDYGDVITVQVTPADSVATGSPVTSSATVTKPATGTTLEYKLPISAVPSGIANGPDGNMWFSLESSNKVGYITPSGKFTLFNLPQTENLGGINTGPDGNIWFCETSINKIAKITPTGTITEYPLPTGTTSVGLAGIVEGSDGNMWFTETTGNSIGKITMNGVVTLYPVPTTKGSPHGLHLGPDGNIWFNEVSGNKIGKITPAGVFTEYPISIANAKPDVITPGPDGNMWFTEDIGKIGRITMTGTITQFSLPNSSAWPVGITAGPDGNIWFAEKAIGKIGRITTSGNITEFPLASSTSQPDKIIWAPDGNLWFTQHYSDQIGRITP